MTKAVRDAVRRRGLPVMIETVSYASHADYPEEFRYPPDVLVDLWPYYHAHRAPIFDPSETSARKSLAPIQQWTAKHVGILGAGCYYRKYRFLSKPMVFPTLMWAEMSYFRDRGIRGISMQSEPGDWLAFELQHYLFARLAYDTSQDVNLLVRDYCAIRFGDACDQMEEYFWTLAKAATRAVRSMAAEPSQHEIAQGRVWVDRCEALLRESRRRLAGDHGRLEMLRRLATTLRHMRISFDLLDLRREGRSRKLAEKKRELLKLARSHASEGIFLDVDGYWLGEIGLEKIYGT